MACLLKDEVGEQAAQAAVAVAEGMQVLVESVESGILQLSFGPKGRIGLEGRPFPLGN